MVLTQRDINFLKDLTTINFLNTKRIYKLFNTEVNCRVRLNKMFKEGIIQHPMTLDNMEYVYCPSKKTYAMFDMEYKKKFPNDKIKHYLACADFYFYMLSQNNLDDFKLEQQYYFNHNGKKYSFRPDIEIVSNGKLLFVEIDLSNRRFENKIETWESFFSSGAFKEHFDKFPPIIIVTTNVNKIKSIVQKAKKIDLNYVYKDYKEVSNWNYNYN